MARDLGLSPSTLSEVLNEKHGISPKKAQRICKILGFTAHETALFCDLVDAEHARNPFAKKVARERLHQRSHSDGIEQLNIDSFAMISQWYHLALLELGTWPTFRSDERWIAKKLGITPQEVISAIDRLERLGLLKIINKRIEITHQRTNTGGEIPSDAIKQFHSQILKKAEQALYEQEIAKRSITSSILSIDSERLPELKNKIAELRREFCGAVNECHNRNSLYVFNISLFQLTEE